MDMEIREWIKDKCYEMISLYHDIVRKRQFGSARLNDRKKSEARYSSTESSKGISEAAMVERLKILMSIPISSTKYSSDNIGAFLEQIWSEKVETFEKEARRNELALFKGRMHLLKQYADKRDKILLKDSLDTMLEELGQLQNTL